MTWIDESKITSKSSVEDAIRVRQEERIKAFLEKSGDEEKNPAAQPTENLAAPEAGDSVAGLLPCPFCGAQPNPPYTNNVGESYAKIKHHETCTFSFGHSRELWISGAAFKRWNTRADIHAQLVAERDALKAVLEKIIPTGDPFSTSRGKFYMMQIPLAWVEKARALALVDDQQKEVK